MNTCLWKAQANKELWGGACQCTSTTVRNITRWVCRNTVGQCCRSYMLCNVKWLIHDSLTAIVTESNILPSPSCVFDPGVHSRCLHGCWVELILRYIFMSGLWLPSPPPTREGELLLLYPVFYVRWKNGCHSLISFAKTNIWVVSAFECFSAFISFFWLQQKGGRGDGGGLRERQKERKNQSAPSILDF